MFTSKDVRLCINAIRYEDANMTIEYAMEHLFSFFTLCFRCIEKIRLIAKGEKNISLERQECLALMTELDAARKHKEKNGFVKCRYKDKTIIDLITRLEKYT